MAPSYTRRCWALGLLILAAAFAAIGDAIPQQLGSVPRRTKSVVLIVLDGLRWQEVFDGPDSALMDEKHGGVEDVPALRKEFCRNTPEEARQAVFPFLWGTVAQQGIIFGNQHKGSVAQVTNGFKFSYPGYNEMLTGSPIDESTATNMARIRTLPSLNGSMASLPSMTASLSSPLGMLSAIFSTRTVAAYSSKLAGTFRGFRL